MNRRIAAALLIGASLGASALALPRSAGAQAAPTPSPAASVVPTVQPVPTIKPSAVPTLPPASSSLQLPYPAVGTPAPNVTASIADPNVPQTITLRQAILIAVAKSPTLASARGDLQLAKANVDTSRVPILPNLSGTASTLKSHRQPGSLTSSTGGTGGQAFVAPDVTANNLSANLRQLLFDGGKTFAQIRGASASQVSFIDLYQRDLQTVAFNVATAYYNALEAQRTTAVDNLIVQQNIVQENLVVAQYRAGQASLVDIATAELPVSTARVNLVKQQGVEAANQAALANAMGLDANTIVRPADDAATYQQVIATALPIPSYERAIAQAYLLRPDLSSAAQVVEAARYSLKSASLGQVPSISGTAGYGTASNDPQGGTFRNSWSIGATMTIPFYDQGLTKANVEQAQGNLAKALASYDTTKLNVQLNVKQALTALISARAALDATVVEYTQASTVLRATQAQYRAGVTTLPLLLNAQVQLTTALTDGVNAIYTLRQAEQAFLYAIGQNT